MALETIEKTIDGVDYKFTQLPFSKARKLLTRLMKVLGPAIAAAVKSAPSLGQEGAEVALKGELQKFSGSLADAAVILCDRLEESLLEDTFDQLAKYSERSVDKEHWKRVSEVMEMEFGGGNMPHAMKWLAAALQVNFGNFFDALPDLGALRAAVAAQTRE